MALKMKTGEKGHCPASLSLPRQAAAFEINPELRKHAGSSILLPLDIFSSDPHHSWVPCPTRVRQQRFVTTEEIHPGFSVFRNVHIFHFS